MNKNIYLEKYFLTYILYIKIYKHLSIFVMKSRKKKITFHRIVSPHYLSKNTVFIFIFLYCFFPPPRVRMITLEYSKKRSAVQFLWVSIRKLLRLHQRRSSRAVRGAERRRCLSDLIGPDEAQRANHICPLTLTSKCSEARCDAALPPGGEKKEKWLQHLDYSKSINYFLFLFINVIIYFIFFIIPLSVCVATRVVFSRSPPFMKKVK